MKYSKYSVIIVGSGIAGMYSALKLTEHTNLPDGILLVSKYKLGDGNSKFAQGGIVGVLKENPSDSCVSHINDTLKAGAGLSDINAVKFISESSDEVIHDLMGYGIDFDKNEKGALSFTLEAAHSIRRILHSGGDATGRRIDEGLCKSVLENEDITVYEDSIVVELLISKEGECRGVIAYNSITDEYEVIYSSHTTLATGGLGQLYKYTTNPLGATGDGLALAYNAGAELRDLEFIQFHPTSLAVDGGENRFLISEAVRGEGAKLIDKSGNEFMAKYHDKRELAPRDIVTRAINSEMHLKHLDKVYLQTSCIDRATILHRFPTIAGVCKKNGIDITTTPIPVSPAAHYSMGGVKTDLNGCTSIKGLYAIGEVSSTGLHGANRLASNSLLECVVCAWSLADYLSFANLTPPKMIDETIKNIIEDYEQNIDDIVYDINNLKTELQQLMWENVGIIRSKETLEVALKQIKWLKSTFRKTKRCLSMDEYEYRNMLEVAELITEAALMRKESRGAHYRTDYLQTDEHGVHSSIKKGELQVAY